MAHVHNSDRADHVSQSKISGLLISSSALLPISIGIVALLVYTRDPLNTAVFRTVILPMTIVSAIMFIMLHRIYAWRTQESLQKKHIIAGCLAAGVFYVIGFYALSLLYILGASLLGASQSSMEMLSDLRLFLLASTAWCIALIVGWLRAITLRS